MIRVFSFLQCNPQSGILSFRFTIPVKYRPIIGKREIKRTTRTTDKRLAIQKAMLYCSDIQDELQKLGEKWVMITAV
jgi:hypothetical protein